MAETQALETGGEVRPVDPQVRPDPQVRRIAVSDVADAFAVALCHYHSLRSGTDALRSRA